MKTQARVRESHVARLAKAAMFIAAFFLCVIANPRAAQADQIDDIVNLSVDALAIGGSAVGVNIGENEKKIIKPLASCLAHGRPVAACAAEAVIKQLPPEVQEQALCAARGNNVAQCAVSFLPPGAQAPAQCLAQGKTVDQCAAEELVRRLPPGSQGLANCIAVERRPVAQCAQEFGQQEAAKILKETVADASGNLTGTPRGVVTNIINIVQGVQEKDIQKVLTNGGEAVAKAVARIAIQILTAGTPFVNTLAGPVIDAVIEHRVDALVDIFDAVKRNDASKLAEVLTNAYFTMFAVVPCAALGTLVPVDAVQEALCGGAAKVIQVLASGVGSAVQAIEDIFRFLGVNEALEEIAGWFTGKQPKSYCGTPAEFYAKHHAICLTRGVYQKLVDAETTDLIDGREFTEVVDRVNIRCRQHFDQCYTSDHFDRLCNPLKDLFKKQAEELYQGLARQANVVVEEEKRKITLASGICADVNRGNLIRSTTNTCVSLVQNRFPLPQEPPGGAEFCAPDLAPMPVPPAQKACTEMTVYRPGNTWRRNTAVAVNEKCDWEKQKPKLSAMNIRPDFSSLFENTRLDKTKLQATPGLGFPGLGIPKFSDPRTTLKNPPTGGMYPTGPGASIPPAVKFDSDRASKLLGIIENTPLVVPGPAPTGGMNPTQQVPQQLPATVRATPGPAFPQQPTGGHYPTQQVPQQPRYQHDPMASAVVSGVVGGAINNAFGNRGGGGGGMNFGSQSRGDGRNVTTGGQQVRGGTNSTAPGTNVPKPGAKKADKRINYGSCSGCGPTNNSSGYPGLR